VSRRRSCTGRITGPVTTISAGPLRRHATLAVIPIVRRARWVASPAYAASGEPLGLLLVEDDASNMRIVPFTDISSWWDEFCAAYPAFAGVQPGPPAGNETGTDA
jgi:hypothetical protein